MTLSVSILNADFTILAKEIEMLNRSAADWIHLDVMDGVFVPNISFGSPVIEAIRKLTAKPLDAHAMVSIPERFIDAYGAMGVDMLTVHYEACKGNLNAVLRHIRSRGMKAGLAINPATDVGVLEGALNETDMVLAMSVNPGFGGQQCMADAEGKLGRIRELLLRKGSAAILSVDGGVTQSNAPLLARAGADALVVGSAVFRADDPVAAIAEFKRAGIAR